MSNNAAALSNIIYQLFQGASGKGLFFVAAVHKHLVVDVDALPVPLKLFVAISGDFIEATRRVW